MQTGKDTNTVEIHCPTCQRVLSGAYVNKRSGLCFCTECNEVFPASELLKEEDQAQQEAQSATLSSEQASSDVINTTPTDKNPKADRVVSAWRTQRTQARSEAAAIERANHKAGVTPTNTTQHDTIPSSASTTRPNPVFHAEHQYSNEADEAALSASEQGAPDHAQESYIAPDFPRDPLPSNTTIKEAACDSITIATKIRSAWALLFIPMMLVVLVWVFSGAATLFLARWGSMGTVLNVVLVVAAIVSVPLCLMLVMGRFEVKLICGRGTVFTGIGNVGLIQRFFLDEADGIAEFSSPLGRWWYVGIHINGNADSVRCGRFLNEEKRYFFVNCLNDLKAMQIRKWQEKSKTDRRKRKRLRAKKTGSSSILNPDSRYGRIFEKE